MSNEIQIHVDHPELAPICYRLAVEKLSQSQDEPDWAVGVAKIALRHLNMLLDNPTVKSAKLISDYWDGRLPERVDPFPEK